MHFLVHTGSKHLNMLIAMLQHLFLKIKSFFLQDYAKVNTVVTDTKQENKSLILCIVIRNKSQNSTA